ncbi:MAG: amidohydrolase [Actinomycetes bacterium]
MHHATLLHEHCPACTPPAWVGRLVDHRPVAPGPRIPVARAPFVDPGTADLLVLGRVVTMDPNRPEAEAIAIAGGRIVAVGTRGEVEDRRGPDTEVLELSETVCYPGFIEPHAHLWISAVIDHWVDASPIAHGTFDEICTVLRAAAADLPEDGWLLAKRYDPSLLPGEPALSRALLDRIVPDHPAIVLNASMHFVYANSRAIAAAGLDDSSTAPAGGTFGRDASGHLDGAFGEMPAIGRILAPVPLASQDQLQDNVVDVLRTAARRGVTRFHEASTGALFGAGELDILHALAGAGRLPTRVSAAIVDNAARAFAATPLTPFAGDDMARVTSWKIVSDGSNQGRSGFQAQPYLGTDDCGHPNYPSSYLVDTIRARAAAGWQVMVHANGDGAIEQVVDAYEEALGGSARTDLRHRIEHCSIPTDDHLARMAAAGISPSFLMNHVHYWGRVLRDRVLGPARADRLDPVASARRHGLRPSFHSDFNVTDIDPLLSVQTAVTRVMRDGGEVLNPDECDTVADALRAITIDAAWQVHADDVTGSIEVGKYADLVLLTADPQAVAPDAIAAIDVVATYVAGARIDA